MVLRTLTLTVTHPWLRLSPVRTMSLVLDALMVPKLTSELEHPLLQPAPSRGAPFAPGGAPRRRRSKEAREPRRAGLINQGAPPALTARCDSDQYPRSPGWVHRTHVCLHARCSEDIPKHHARDKMMRLVHLSNILGRLDLARFFV